MSLCATSLLCRLPDSLHHWLQAAAHYYGVSPSVLVTRAVTDYRRRLKQQGLPCDHEAIEALGTAVCSPFAVEYPEAVEPVAETAIALPVPQHRKTKKNQKGRRR